MIYLEIDPPYQEILGDGENLLRAAQTSLDHQQTKQPSSLSVRITGEDRMRALNQQYRGIDAPTDVLSFEAGYQDPDSGDYYLGDILISYPRAEAQARAEAHTTGEELQLLVVHGTLHLLGLDHRTPEEKQLMWQRQAEILELLGLSIEVK